MIRFMYMIGCLLILSLASVGCVGGDQHQVVEENAKLSVSFVIGYRSNVPSIPVQSETIQGYLHQACSTYGKISIVNVDGNPDVHFSKTIPEPTVKGLSDNKLKSIADGYSQQLMTLMASSEADESQADVLKAIKKGAAALDSQDEGERLLVIMDNGISTSGYLKFQEQDLLYGDPKEIARKLDEEAALPDLEGIHIVWLYLGETAPPQEDLNDYELMLLGNIWMEILTQARAESVHFKKELIPDDYQEGLPLVDTIKTSDEHIDVVACKNEPEEEEYSQKDLQGPISFDSEDIMFIADTADLVSIEDARMRIGDVANYLLENKDVQISVLGCTATGDWGFTYDLSQARAGVIKKLLVSEGINESRIIAKGLAYENPWHVDDVDSTGRLVETYALQNRKVVIIRQEDYDKLIPNG